MDIPINTLRWGLLAIASLLIGVRSLWLYRKKPSKLNLWFTAAFLLVALSMIVYCATAVFLREPAHLTLGIFTGDIILYLGLWAFCVVFWYFFLSGSRSVLYGLMCMFAIFFVAYVAADIQQFAQQQVVIVDSVQRFWIFNIELDIPFSDWFKLLYAVGFIPVFFVGLYLVRYMTKVKGWARFRTLSIGVAVGGVALTNLVVPIYDTTATQYFKYSYWLYIFSIATTFIFVIYKLVTKPNDAWKR